MCDDSEEEYIIYKGKKLHPGGGIYLGTTEKFFHGEMRGISRCIKVGGGTCAAVVVRVSKEKYEEIQNCFVEQR